MLRLLAVAAFFLPLIARAQTPPGFDPVKWQALKTQAELHGKPFQAPDALLHVLSYLNPPDENQTHLAEYFSAVGAVDPQTGIFSSYEFHAVHEIWTLQGDRWDIDQWIYILNLDGNLLNHIHAHLIEDLDGRVYEDTFLNSSEQEALAHWALDLSDWESRL